MKAKPILSLFFLFTFLLNCSQRPERVEFSGIIPQPKAVSQTSGYFRLGKVLNVAYGQEFKVSGAFLSEFLKSAGITIGKGKDLVFIKDSTINKEAYELEIRPGQIQIKAGSDQGAFYAVQSLRQLLPHHFEGTLREFQSIELPCINISDAPEFGYRGMHLDVGRHMFPVEFIKKYIDALALLKMNTFHWHLTEDQGWRIEIKNYPKLQEVAAFRKETLIGHYSDQPQQFDGKRYGGYYTQEEVKDIVAYAQERFVTIIPEIEMPGHSQAAIAAYPYLGCNDENVEVATKWGIFEEIYCPTEETFAFLEDVLDEVMALFPSKYIHIGGDEAPKTRWEESAFCQQLIKEKGLKDEHELQSYFIGRIEKYLNSKGREIIGWDEILEGGLAPNATVMSWRGTKGAIEAAKQGHDVVMTPNSHCYFDYYQSKNEGEPLAIGGFLPLEKVYSFNPIPEELTAEEAHYVQGVQGNVWTEYMPDEEKVEYMVFPRILAMSEVAWTNPAQKDYKGFVNKVEHFHQRLEALGINFANHLYDLEGEIKTIDNNVYLELTTPIQGKNIRYTSDGIPHTSDSEIYSAVIPLAESMEIQAAVFEDNKQLGNVFSIDFKNHKAVGQNISINKTPYKAFTGSGPTGLVNGVNGSDTRFGDKEWLGFWGEDIEIEIDLEEVIEINSITTRFYNGKGQWIYAPKRILIGFLRGDHQGVPEFKEIEIETTSTNLVDLKVDFEGFESSKVIIKVPNYGTIPAGAQGAGNKAWTFIDEIIIN